MESSSSSSNLVHQEDPRRRILVHMIAALIHEVGFNQVSKDALEILVEMMQANLIELGRITRAFTEVAGRVEPTAGDIMMALIDMGHRVDAVSLRNYARRHSRPIIPNPQGIPPPKVPQILTAGKRRNLPPYIPDYFPPMPDPHTYIRTPTHKQPLSDYAACREKMSTQKRDLERSLTKFNARTSPCFYLFPDSKSLFPLISPSPTTYLSPLVHKDQIFEEEGLESLAINRVKRERIERGEDGEKVVSSYELIDNPFLRAPRVVTGKKGRKSGGSGGNSGGGSGGSSSTRAS